jgi:hypothetical protein
MNIEFEEFSKCISDPIYFLENYVTIKTPYGDHLPFKLFVFQKELVDSYVKNKHTTLSTNGMGVTTITAGYILWYLIFNRNRTVCLASENTINVRALYDLIDEFYGRIPSFLKPKIDKQTITRTVYSNNSQIIVKELNKICGITPTLIVTEDINVEKFIAPMLNTGGKTITIKL